MTTLDRPGAGPSPDATPTCSFTLNGEQVTVSGEHLHLLSAIRDGLPEGQRVTSAKDGCSPSGQCGCCTVLIDGKARIACSTPLEKVAGSDVVTLEGLPDDEVARYAEAFAACGALQCGFCTPGIVMRAKSLVDKDDLEPKSIELQGRQYAVTEWSLDPTYGGFHRASQGQPVKLLDDLQGRHVPVEELS